MRCSVWWCPMRKFAFALPLAISTILLSSSAFADSEIVSCRDYARTAADIWSANDVARADDLETAPPQTYVAIVAGRKYFVPVHQTDETSARIPTIGQRALWRAQVYREELRRCLGARTLTITHIN
jgi:hypothetical protein